MKTLDIPQSGKCGDKVASHNHYGPHVRARVVPTDPHTAAQDLRRCALSDRSAAWGRLLTDQQRRSWTLSAAKVRSRVRLGKSHPLTGQAHFVGINSVLACIGRDMVLDPPSPVVFSPNPVRQFSIGKADGRLALQLSVSEPLTEEIMVFGSAPCSPGRMKCRNPVYLGLLPAPAAGLSDITRMYVAKLGVPPSGSRVFIRTRQQTNGWVGGDHDISQIVPARQAPVPRRRGA